MARWRPCRHGLSADRSVHRRSSAVSRYRAAMPGVYQQGVLMADQRVSVEVSDGVADVRLARPEKRNALDIAMFAGLVRAGEELKSSAGLRAVVLSGEGPDFCAGLDFTSFSAMASGERLSFSLDVPPSAGPAQALGQRAAFVWAELPVPVI